MVARRRWPNPEELHAARMIHHFAGLVPVPNDGTVAGSNLPDFDLLRGEDVLGVLEVTRYADRTMRATVGALRKRPIELPGARTSWHVQIERDTNAARLAAALPRLVQDAEASGAWRVTRRDPLGRRLPLEDLGIRLMYSGPMEVTPRAQVVVVAPGGSTHRDLLAEVVEFEATKPDNVRKLSHGGRDERHLWVWLEYDAPGGADVMVMSLAKGLPGREPRLPVGVPPATIWLCVDFRRDVVSWDATRGWQVHRVDVGDAVYEPDATVPMAPKAIGGS